MSFVKQFCLVTALIYCWRWTLRESSCRQSKHTPMFGLEKFLFSFLNNLLITIASKNQKNKTNKTMKVSHHEFRETEAIKEANMDAPVSTQHMITTEFVDEGPVEVESGSADYVFSYKKEQDAIKDFLAKPTIAATYTWTKGGGTGASVLGSINVSDYFRTTGSTYYSNKLQGFNLVRAKAHFQLRVNANPFQQGLLIMHFLPCTSEFSAGWVNTRNKDLTLVSQHPHVYLDCRESIAELSIPYIAPFTHYDIANNKYSFGKLYVGVMDDLNVSMTGETSLNVTLTISFSDVELSAPMVANMDAESMSVAKTKVVSKGLRSAAKVVKGLTAIPSLSAYATPTAWALDRAAGLASHFGYSKPTLDSSTIPVQSHGFRDMACGEGEDNSYHLTVLRRNEVKTITDSTPETVDEMSMNYLLRKEYFWASYTWTTATTTLINNQYIAPSLLSGGGSYASGAKTATYKSGGPLWYMSNYFQFYRGGIKLRLKFVKTQFHTGRLQITWQPTYNNSTLPSDTTLLLREIVDIRDSDEITLILPYMLPFTFAPQGDAMGALNIVVLNELRFPESCANQINMLVFVSAADDFEFAAPLNSGNNIPPLMIGNADDLVPERVIGGNNNVARTLLPAEIAMGETITSVKQLLHRASMFGINGSIATTNTSIAPWFFGGSTTSAGTIPVDGPGGDLMSSIGLMYCFFRGSVVLTQIGGSWSTGGIPAYLSNSPGSYIYSTSAFPASISGWNWGTPGGQIQAWGGVISAAVAGTLAQWTVPYYNTTRMSLLDFTLHNTQLGSADASVPTVALATDANSVTRFARSAGDDFQLSYFIGCPPLLISLV